MIHPELRRNNSLEATPNHSHPVEGHVSKPKIKFGLDAPLDVMFMHTSMMVGDQVLAGADAFPGHYEKPQGTYVTLDIPSPKEADQIFAALSEKGSVQMECQETFWAQRFGMVIDRFGTPWMINCGKP